MTNIIMNNFKKAAHALETHSSLPILTCVLVFESGGIVATNLDLHIQAGDCGGAAAAVDGAKFKKILTAFKDTPTIRIAEGRLSITDGKRSYALDVESADLFPDPVGYNAIFTVSSALPAAQVFARIEAFVGDDKNRYYLHGINMRNADGRIVAEASDGCTAAQTYCGGQLPSNQSFIVPAETARAVRTVFKGAELVKISIGLDPDKTEGETEGETEGAVRFVVFEDGDCRVASKVIGAPFPDVDRIMAFQDPEVACRVRVADLKDAVEGSLVVSPENAWFESDQCTSTMEVSVRQITETRAGSGKGQLLSVDRGRADFVQTIDGQVEESGRFGADPKNVLRVLAALRCDHVAISCSGFLVRFDDGDSDDRFAVVINDASLTVEIKGDSE